MVHAARAARHVVLSIDAPVGESQIALGTLIAATGAYDEIDDGVLASLLGALDPDERRVLTLRFGLDGGDRRPASRPRGSCRAGAPGPSPRGTRAAQAASGA